MSDETETKDTRKPDRVAQLVGVVAGVALGAYVATKAVAENDNGFVSAVLMFLLIGGPTALLAIKFVEAGRAFLSGDLIDDWEKVARTQGRIADERRAKAEAAANAQRAARDEAARRPAAKPPAPAEPAGEDVGRRPPGLDEPRGGERDDLKKIRGIGPKMEAWLNAQGYWHYDQIAAWDADEVAWADANIEGVKGRVSRDDWVAQAKALAAGEG